MTDDAVSKRARLLYVVLLALAAIALAASILGMIFEDFLARFSTETF